MERMFKYFASWRYFLDRLDKLLAFESNAVKEKKNINDSLEFLIKCIKI